MLGKHEVEGSIPSWGSRLQETKLPTESIEKIWYCECCTPPMKHYSETSAAEHEAIISKIKICQHEDPEYRAEPMGSGGVYFSRVCKSCYTQIGGQSIFGTDQVLLKETYEFIKQYRDNKIASQ